MERPRTLLTLATIFQVALCWLQIQLFKKDFEASVSHRFISFEVKGQEAASRKHTKRFSLAT